MQRMGGLESILKFLPGGNKLAGAEIDEKALAHTEAIILSMTKAERQDPTILNASRRKRIAAGCGQPVSKINSLIKKYESVV